MKLAISSTDGKVNSVFSIRFARCEYFVFVDSETRQWQAVTNPALEARGGAGAQVVQFLADHGIDATISGRYGPTAFTALKAAGIKAYLADSGTPQELLEQFLAGQLALVDAATGASLHH
jgi:predicted Fe-Mo cluster-binding NifX family protein